MYQELLSTLKTRFHQNIHRHKGIEWKKVEAKLKDNVDKLRSLDEMEKTGGEPDVIGYDTVTEKYIFFDCSTESPKGRRSLCYDHKALVERKENKPENSAVGMVKDMGIELLTEEEYRLLQTLGKFDLKTSSWIKTPDNIRKLGGAIFADFRYEHIFIYHNGASSYYAARGFRCKLRV
jgi:hypothetical protein